MGEAFRTKLPAGQKFVLLALCDWANDMGGSIYPRIKTLAVKCSMSERAVQGYLAQLEEAGLVSRVYRDHRSSRFLINVTALSGIEKIPDDPDTWGGEESAGGGAPHAPGGAGRAPPPVQDVHPYPLQALSTTEPLFPTGVGKEVAGKPKKRTDSKAPVQITKDAMDTFNATLSKAAGGNLSGVTAVALEQRQQDVARCLTVAKRICEQQYGTSNITRQFWEDYWEAVKADPFKSGAQGGGGGHENWRPTFEYLTRPKTMADVFEKSISEVTP